MNLVHRVETWGDAHHPGFVDIIRVGLGLFLLFKGIAFMENTEYLKELIARQDVINIAPGVLMALVYYVTFAHMVGGVLIALGILTRFGCLIQIPIVLGAVFMTGIFEYQINALVWPSIAALIALILFLVLGSGPFSFDRYLANNKPRLS
ncbi:MAG TPA: DoxX family protein [Mucilaginibacter sp.]|nr:DoxX family protein [Mucilaginibacter sp.]